MFHSGAVFAGSFFGIYPTLDDNFDEIPAIWTSSDGLAWEQANPPGFNQQSDRNWAGDLAAGPAGLLALNDLEWEGPALWLTTNGRDWDQVVDTGFDGEQVDGIGATQAGYVAFGSAMWTSVDGREWQKLDGSAPLPSAWGVQDVVGFGNQLLAIASGSNGQLEVWSATDMLSWQEVARLPHSRGVHNAVLAAGPLGWVITGADEDSDYRENMWVSPDGVSWTKVSPALGPVSDVFVDRVGFVAVGFVHEGTGCLYQEGEIQGFTWTSLDGLTWAQMPLEGFVRGRIDQLFRDGRTLIGVGVRYDEEDLDVAIGTVWTARLPSVAPAGPALTPAPTPSTEPGGCGPD
jgi:hypothetical protein